MLGGWALVERKGGRRGGSWERRKVGPYGGGTRSLQKRVGLGGGAGETREALPLS